VGRFYSELNRELRDFITGQKIFFVATAPKEGRINISPKGMDTFRCLDSKRVAYLDLTGSGNETAAHLFENGRMTIMFCSFSDNPLVLRLYGHGRVIRQQDDEWRKLHVLFPPLPGTRQIILLEVESIQTSCGYGVPIYEFKKERDTLLNWAEKKGEQGIRQYWREHNQTSIDGLSTNLLKD
jgi:hypothetical protein